MNDKKNVKFILYIVIFIVFLISVSSLAAYAFFAGTTELNTKLPGNITSQDPTKNLTFNLTKDANINYTVNARNLVSFSSSDSYTSYDESTPVVNVSYQVSGITQSVYPKGIKCYYDIYYTPIDSFTQSAYATTNNLNELVIYGVNDEDIIEVSLDGLSEKTLLASKTLTSNIGSSSASATWQFKMRFYNLNGDQSDAMDQSIRGKINVETTTCEVIQ